MKRRYKLIIGLLAAMALSWAHAVYAADNGTEFGIEDDLTVLGTGGTAADPDLEIKGFSVFGATQAAPALNIPAAPGNIFVNGYVQVSSGMYVAGASTFAANAYFNGVSSFSAAASAYFNGVSSFTAGPGSLYVGGGATGQVLKKAANGSMSWAPDDAGAGAISGTQNRVVMFGAGGTGGADSQLQQDANNLSMTLLNGATMTILGNGTDGLGVTGATKLNGNTSILGANTLTVGTGLTSLGGALNVAGASTLTSSLTVNSSAAFGSGATKSTFTATGDLQVSSGGVITLLGNASKITLPNLPTLGTDAANKTYVDNQIGNGGPWTRDNAISAVKLSTITDNVGIGIAVPVAKLQVSSANALAGDALLVVSSGTAAAQQVLTVNASGDMMAKGNAQLGGSVNNTHGVNMAPAADTALSIAGQSVSGDYAAKFYSGNALAAWIRKK